MGAFILCSCYIDYLAGFRFGKPGGGKDYKKFIEIYLPNYDPDTIYTDMRCGIVHNIPKVVATFLCIAYKFAFLQARWCGQDYFKLRKFHGRRKTSCRHLSRRT